MLWAVLAAVVVRLIVVGFVYQSFLVPERQHWLFGFEIAKIAQSIIQGHGFGNLYFGDPTGPTAEIAPVLPYVMAGIFAMFGIYTKAAAIAMLSLNSLFSALTCIPVFVIARRCFGPRIAHWAAWSWAFFPYAIYFSADSMWDHALVGLLLTCVFCWTLCLPDSPRHTTWAAFGLLCGFAALVNPIVLGVVPLLAAWACYRLRQSGRRWIQLALTASMLTCVVIAPWLIRNYRTFGRPVFLKDNLPLELCVGNLGSGLYWWDGDLHPSGSPTELEAFHRLGEQAYMDRKWTEARQFIETHPAYFIRRSIRRFVYVWTGYWSFDRRYLQVENFDLEDIPLRTALTLFAFIGIWKTFRHDVNTALPFLVMLVIFPLAYYVTHPEIGYRTSIDPEILILGCYGLLAAPATADGRMPGRRKGFAIQSESVQTAQSHVGAADSATDD
ncbi:MAG: glycosyltransferase family 39 protein [Acidobacteriota bacterium]|nr:glycosyltransferase family 39 protein [Acidobacteriota bacterium]